MQQCGDNLWGRRGRDERSSSNREALSRLGLSHEVSCDKHKNGLFKVTPDAGEPLGQANSALEVVPGRSLTAAASASARATA